MDAQKEEFLKEFGADYGYPNGPKTIDEIRATEFKRLDGQIFSLSFFFLVLIEVVLCLVAANVKRKNQRKLRKDLVNWFLCFIFF